MTYRTIFSLYFNGFNIYSQTGMNVIFPWTVKELSHTVNSEIFMRVLFSINFTYAKFQLRICELS